MVSDMPQSWYCTHLDHQTHNRMSITAARFAKVLAKMVSYNLKCGEVPEVEIASEFWPLQQHSPVLCDSLGTKCWVCEFYIYYRQSRALLNIFDTRSNGMKHRGVEDWPIHIWKLIQSDTATQLHPPKLCVKLDKKSVYSCQNIIFLSNYLSLSGCNPTVTYVLQTICFLKKISLWKKCYTQSFCVLPENLTL